MAGNSGRRRRGGDDRPARAGLASAWLAAVIVSVTGSLAFAQTKPTTPDRAGARGPQPVTYITSSIQGELHGTIEDDKGLPLGGALVSALGATTAFAISSSDGRFALRNLPAGPYLLRAHLTGYAPARGRVIHVAAGGRSTHTLLLTRAEESPEVPVPPVLAAGVGTSGTSTTPPEDDHAHGEVAWRLRHLKRGVLKEVESAIADVDGDNSFFESPLAGLGRAVGRQARMASSLFSDFSLNGDVNLLTTTSFDRPQDLFALGTEMPRGVAYVSLAAPTGNGDWLMRGTITQGDLSSWIVTTSYRRASDATHAYETGVSYGSQQYLGGNRDALVAIPDGSRNVGSLFAYDNWAVAPGVRVGYGARYAFYDYLPDESLISPRASVTIRPSRSDSLTVRAAVSRRETAPGAEEFTPPSVGLWLPPERTFSQLSRAAFRPERLDHVEVAAERQWLGVLLGARAFHQRVDDQVMTLFGATAVERQRDSGHYYVASAGDFDARGWGVSVSRPMGDGIRASIDYTQFDSRWSRPSPDLDAIRALASSVLRTNERIHDVTATVDSVVASTDTRVYVLYKVNSGFAPPADMSASPWRHARFNLQINQGLPFLTALSANWEMVVAVSNVFRDEPLDSSVYDELFVLGPPKRMLCGVTMRF